MKKVLFVIDKLELKYFEFNKLVTNFWLIKEFLEQNAIVYITINPYLHLVGDIAYAKCYEAKFDAKNINIFYDKSVIADVKIDDFDLVLFRPDPPVDVDYINATYVFDYVHTKVVNSPRAIRNFNEKLHSLNFKDYMPEAIVTASIEDIEKFLSIHKQIVLKPLNKCFGSGVMYLYEGDPNTHTIINMVTNNSNTLVMVQAYIKEVKNGDVRVLTLGDKILPYAVKKLPGKNDFKFNEHDDNFVVKSDYTIAELSQFTPIAQKLNQEGIIMAGLDVIGDKVIEINITSPCYFIREINNAYGVHLEKEVANFLLTSNLLLL